ncbi:hypothetical protein FQN52_007245 [Onygenales sp. PD_12]|nr:hypothetical protein FQN52_007245 [Onygenales sp. PD_12]
MKSIAMLTLGASLIPHSTAAWSGISHLFVFGNSYTTTGFDPTNDQPNRENPFGNPAYPGYTSSNGPNWIDFLTTTYNDSFIQTYNLAYGGATVDSDLVAPYQPTVLSLKDQVEDQFLPIYASKPSFAKWNSLNSLFAFWIGINDVVNSYASQNETLYDAVFDVYSELIDEIYEAGGRNFLFLDVPPVDRSPLTASQGQAAQNLEASSIEQWNSRLGELAEETQAQYENVKVLLFSTHSLFSKVLDDPSSYEETAVYKNTTAYCAEYENGTPEWTTFNETCGIPVNEYFWLNSLHPTYPVHNATASGIAALLRAQLGNMC